MTVVSASLEVSVNTGYDWGETTEATKSEQTTKDLQATAPAGLDRNLSQCYNVIILTPRNDSDD